MSKRHRINKQFSSVTSPKRDRHAISTDQILYSRKQAARLLGNVSVMTVIRLEERGKLSPKRLNPKARRSKVFYPVAQVHALVEN